jgi:hypothetical protein
MQVICAKYGLQTPLVTTQRNRVFAIAMDLICAEFELEIRLAIIGKIRVSYSLSEYGLDT